jgi:hypothetical protein
MRDIKYIIYWLKWWYKYLFTKNTYTSDRPITKKEIEEANKMTTKFIETVSTFGFTIDEAAEALSELGKVSQKTR